MLLLDLYMEHILYGCQAVIISVTQVLSGVPLGVRLSWRGVMVVLEGCNATILSIASAASKSFGWVGLADWQW